MKIVRAAVALLAGGVGVSGLLLAGCEDVALPEPCANIPDGGCPRKGSQVCTDPTCEAVYVCTADRTWQLDSVCAAREAGVVAVDAGRDAAVGDATVSRLRDGAIDVPGASGGPGCSALEEPDCPLGAAQACPLSSCCGCDDLFVCANGGWSVWGKCANGTLTKQP